MNISQIVEALSWAVEQAEENLGAHTGGPNEQAYREQLARAEDALSDLQEYEHIGL